MQIVGQFTGQFVLESPIEFSQQDSRDSPFNDWPIMYPSYQDLVVETSEPFPCGLSRYCRCDLNDCTYAAQHQVETELLCLDFSVKLAGFNKNLAQIPDWSTPAYKTFFTCQELVDIACGEELEELLSNPSYNRPSAHPEFEQASVAFLADLAKIHNTGPLIDSLFMAAPVVPRNPSIIAYAGEEVDKEIIDLYGDRDDGWEELSATITEERRSYFERALGRFGSMVGSAPVRPAHGIIGDHLKRPEPPKNESEDETQEDHEGEPVADFEQDSGGGSVEEPEVELPETPQFAGYGHLAMPVLPYSMSKLPRSPYTYLECYYTKESEGGEGLL